MQNSKNSVVLSTKKEEDDADDLLSALSVMATAVPKSKQKDIKTVNSIHAEAAKRVASLTDGALRALPRKKKKAKPLNSTRKSRFFFKITESFEDEMSRRQRELEASRDPGMVSLDAEVDERRDRYIKELPPRLQRNIVNVREFFLKEIGPLTLAGSAGTTQAREVIQRTLNAPVNEQPFAQFERMLGAANTLKMARFITKYAGLNPGDAASLLSSISPKREVVFAQPLPDERRAPPAKEKVQPVEE